MRRQDFQLDFNVRLGKKGVKMLLVLALAVLAYAYIEGRY